MVSDEVCAFPHFKNNTSESSHIAREDSGGGKWFLMGQALYWVGIYPIKSVFQP
jgi:hypothetical protein